MRPTTKCVVKSLENDRSACAAEASPRAHARPRLHRNPTPMPHSRRAPPHSCLATGSCMPDTARAPGTKELLRAIHAVVGVPHTATACHSIQSSVGERLRLARKGMKSSMLSSCVQACRAAGCGRTSCSHEDNSVALVHVAVAAAEVLAAAAEGARARARGRVLVLWFTHGGQPTLQTLLRPPLEQRRWARQTRSRSSTSPHTAEAQTGRAGQGGAGRCTARLAWITRARTVRPCNASRNVTAMTTREAAGDAGRARTRHLGLEAPAHVVHGGLGGLLVGEALHGCVALPAPHARSAPA